MNARPHIMVQEQKADLAISSFEAAIAACHQNGSKVSIQLQHAGPEGNSKVTGYPLQSASAIPASVKTEVPEAMPTEEVYRLIEAYGDAPRSADCGKHPEKSRKYNGCYLQNQWLG